MSVNRHLTSGASVRPENAVTYSAGNEGQKICGVFSETAPLQRSSTPSVVRPCVQSAIFPCVFLVYAHAYFSCIYAHDTPPRVQHFSAFHSRYDSGDIFKIAGTFALSCTTTNSYLHIENATLLYSSVLWPLYQSYLLLSVASAGNSASLAWKKCLHTIRTCTIVDLLLQ